MGDNATERRRGGEEGRRLVGK
ncbi:hypothetical protein A2U01_0075638, partial [Trifolium medium]|nr:hypothetical protein [Trifolium medium]